jgi:hypothetical protein
MAMMEGVNKYDLLVFAELDNLEYVVEKYRLGHISDEQAYREWRAFPLPLQKSDVLCSRSKVGSKNQKAIKFTTLDGWKNCSTCHSSSHSQSQ